MLAGPVLEHRVPQELLAEAKRLGSPDYWPLSVATLAALDQIEAIYEAPTTGRRTVPEWIADPLKSEMLNLWVLDAIKGLVSGEEHRCVAFDASDLLSGAVRDCIEKDRGVSLAAVKSVMREWVPYEKVENDGALVERLIDPEEDEASRADRHQLMSFASHNVPLSATDAHSLGKFACAVSKEESPRPQFWAQACDSNNRLTTDIRSLPWMYLKFLGSISDADWEALLAGSRLTARRLGVTDSLKKLMDSGLVTVSGKHPVPDIYTHTGELYREVDFADTPIQAKHLSDQVYRLFRGKVENTAGWSTFDQFARMFAISSLSIRFDGDKPILPVTREQFEDEVGGRYIRVGRVSGVELFFELPLGYWSSRKIVEEAAFDKEPILYRTLPDSVRTEIWTRAVARAIAIASSTKSQPALIGSGSSSPPAPIKP